MRRFALIAFLAPVVTLCQPSARAQSKPDLPTAETVLDQYIEATGGKAAYEKLQSRVAKGTVEISGANITGKITISHAAPAKMSLVMDLGDLAGITTQGTDGKDVWEVSPVTGERLMDGDEKAAFLRQANFNSELHWKELYSKVECVGVEDVDGKPAYKLVFTPKSGKPKTEYYDKASHLMVKETGITTTPMGDVAVEAIPADYKRADGVLMPFTVTQKVLTQQIVMKMNEIKHNVDIPPNTFKRPAVFDDAAKKKAQ
jgi:hypothetical protein